MLHQHEKSSSLTHWMPDLYIRLNDLAEASGRSLDHQLRRQGLALTAASQHQYDITHSCSRMDRECFCQYLDKFPDAADS